MKIIICSKCKQPVVVLNNKDYVLCCGEVIYVNKEQINENYDE
jgi:hypothetical protein